MHDQNPNDAEESSSTEEEPMQIMFQFYLLHDERKLLPCYRTSADWMVPITMIQQICFPLERLLFVEKVVHERTDRSLTKMTKVEIDEMRLWLKSAKTEPKQDFPVLTEKEFSCRLQDLEINYEDFQHTFNKKIKDGVSEIRLASAVQSVCRKQKKTKKLKSRLKKKSIQNVSLKSKEESLQTGREDCKIQTSYEKLQVPVVVVDGNESSEQLLAASTEKETKTTAKQLKKNAVSAKEETLQTSKEGCKAQNSDKKQDLLTFAVDRNNSSKQPPIVSRVKETKSTTKKRKKNAVSAKEETLQAYTESCKTQNSDKKQDLRTVAVDSNDTSKQLPIVSRVKETKSTTKKRKKNVVSTKEETLQTSKEGCKRQNSDKKQDLPTVAVDSNDSSKQLPIVSKVKKAKSTVKQLKKNAVSTTEETLQANREDCKTQNSDEKLHFPAVAADSNDSSKQLPIVSKVKETKSTTKKRKKNAVSAKEETLQTSKEGCKTQNTEEKPHLPTVAVDSSNSSKQPPIVSRVKETKSTTKKRKKNAVFTKEETLQASWKSCKTQNSDEKPHLLTVAVDSNDSSKQLPIVSKLKEAKSTTKKQKKKKQMIVLNKNKQKKSVDLPKLSTNVQENTIDQTKGNVTLQCSSAYLPQDSGGSTTTNSNHKNAPKPALKSTVQAVVNTNTRSDINLIGVTGSDTFPFSTPICFDSNNHTLSSFDHVLDELLKNVVTDKYEPQNQKLYNKSDFSPEKILQKTGESQENQVKNKIKHTTKAYCLQSHANNKTVRAKIHQPPKKLNFSKGHLESSTSDKTNSFPNNCCYPGVRSNPMRYNLSTEDNFFSRWHENSTSPSYQYKKETDFDEIDYNKSHFVTAKSAYICGGNETFRQNLARGEIRGRRYLPSRLPLRDANFIHSDYAVRSLSPQNKSLQRRAQKPARTASRTHVAYSRYSNNRRSRSVQRARSYLYKSNQKISKWNDVNTDSKRKFARWNIGSCHQPLQTSRTATVNKSLDTLRNNDERNHTSHKAFPYNLKIVVNAAPKLAGHKESERRIKPVPNIFKQNAQGSSEKERSVSDLIQGIRHKHLHHPESTSSNVWEKKAHKLFDARDFITKKNLLKTKSNNFFHVASSVQVADRLDFEPSTGLTANSKLEEHDNRYVKGLEEPKGSDESEDTLDDFVILDEDWEDVDDQQENVEINFDGLSSNHNSQSSVTQLFSDKTKPNISHKNDKENNESAWPFSIETSTTWWPFAQAQGNNYYWFDAFSEFQSKNIESSQSEIENSPTSSAALTCQNFKKLHPFQWKKKLIKKAERHAFSLKSVERYASEQHPKNSIEVIAELLDEIVDKTVAREQQSNSNLVAKTLPPRCSESLVKALPNDKKVKRQQNVSAKMVKNFQNDKKTVDQPNTSEKVIRVLSTNEKTKSQQRTSKKVLKILSNDGMTNNQRRTSKRLLRVLSSGRNSTNQQIRRCSKRISAMLSIDKKTKNLQSKSENVNKALSRDEKNEDQQSDFKKVRVLQSGDNSTNQQEKHGIKKVITVFSNDVKTKKLQHSSEKVVTVVPQNEKTTADQPSSFSQDVEPLPSNIKKVLPEDNQLNQQMESISEKETERRSIQLTNNSSLTSSSRCSQVTESETSEVSCNSYSPACLAKVDFFSNSSKKIFFYGVSYKNEKKFKKDAVYPHSASSVSEKINLPKRSTECSPMKNDGLIISKEGALSAGSKVNCIFENENINPKDLSKDSDDNSSPSLAQSHDKGSDSDSTVLDDIDCDNKNICCATDADKVSLRRYAKPTQKSVFFGSQIIKKCSVKIENLHWLVEPAVNTSNNNFKTSSDKGDSESMPLRDKSSSVNQINEKQDQTKVSIKERRSSCIFNDTKTKVSRKPKAKKSIYKASTSAQKNLDNLSNINVPNILSTIDIPHVNHDNYHSDFQSNATHGQEFCATESKINDQSNQSSVFADNSVIPIVHDSSSLKKDRKSENEIMVKVGTSRPSRFKSTISTRKQRRRLELPSLSDDEDLLLLTEEKVPATKKSLTFNSTIGGEATDDDVLLISCKPFLSNNVVLQKSKKGRKRKPGKASSLDKLSGKTKARKMSIKGTKRKLNAGDSELLVKKPTPEHLSSNSRSPPQSSDLVEIESVLEGIVNNVVKETSEADRRKKNFNLFKMELFSSASTNQKAKTIPPSNDGVLIGNGPVAECFSLKNAVASTSLQNNKIPRTAEISTETTTTPSTLSQRVKRKQLVSTNVTGNKEIGSKRSIKSISPIFTAKVPAVMKKGVGSNDGLSEKRCAVIPTSFSSNASNEKLHSSAVENPSCSVDRNKFSNGAQSLVDSSTVCTVSSMMDKNDLRTSDLTKNDTSVISRVVSFSENESRSVQASNTNKAIISKAVDMCTEVIAVSSTSNVFHESTSQPRNPPRMILLARQPNTLAVSRSGGITLSPSSESVFGETYHHGMMEISLTAPATHLDYGNRFEEHIVPPNNVAFMRRRIPYIQLRIQKGSYDNGKDTNGSSNSVSNNASKLDVDNPGTNLIRLRDAAFALKLNAMHLIQYVIKIGLKCYTPNMYAKSVYDLIYNPVAQSIANLGDLLGIHQPVSDCLLNENSMLLLNDFLKLILPAFYWENFNISIECLPPFVTVTTYKPVDAVNSQVIEAFSKSYAYNNALIFDDIPLKRYALFGKESRSSMQSVAASTNQQPKTRKSQTKNLNRSVARPAKKNTRKNNSNKATTNSASTIDSSAIQTITVTTQKIFNVNSSAVQVVTNKPVGTSTAIVGKSLNDLTSSWKLPTSNMPAKTFNKYTVVVPSKPTVPHPAANQLQAGAIYLPVSQSRNENTQAENSATTSNVISRDLLFTENKKNSSSQTITVQNYRPNLHCVEIVNQREKPQKTLGASFVEANASRTEDSRRSRTDFAQMLESTEQSHQASAVSRANSVSSNVSNNVRSLSGTGLPSHKANSKTNEILNLSTKEKNGLQTSQPFSPQSSGSGNHQNTVCTRADQAVVIVNLEKDSAIAN